MAEIIKVFREEIPAMRFIGKKYHDYSGWGEWFANGWFDVVENSMGGTGKILELWENGGGYVGLECRKDGELLEYWIGMFTPENTEVPEGFSCLDFPKANLGICWIYGRDFVMPEWNRGSMKMGLKGPLKTVCVPALQRRTRREM